MQWLKRLFGGKSKPPEPEPKIISVIKKITEDVYTLKNAGRLEDGDGFTFRYNGVVFRLEFFMQRGSSNFNPSKYFEIQAGDHYDSKVYTFYSGSPYYSYCSRLFRCIERQKEDIAEKVLDDVLKVGRPSSTRPEPLPQAPPGV